MATTIDSMTSFTVFSPFFENNVQLELFPEHAKQNHKNRVALLYGKNGSGKSTIAQGFRELSECKIPRSVTIQPYSGAAQIKITPDGRPEKIHVFDEVYVESNIKVKQSSLDSIVLFGKQADIEKELQEVKEELEDLNAAIETQIAEIELYNDVSNIKSPEYWYNSIVEMLQRRDGWAETVGKRIKHNSIKAKVSAEIVHKIGSLSPKKTSDELLDEFNKRYDLYKSIDSNATTIDIEIKPIIYDPEIENRSIALLKTPLEKPTLSEREEELLKIFGIEAIHDAKDFLLDVTNSECPFCLQHISDEYRSATINSINAILNKDVQDFREQLSNLLLTKISIDDYDPYRDIALQDYSELRTALDKLNAAISEHNSQIQARIDNTFLPIAYTPCEQLLTSYCEANQVLSKLEANRLNYNRVIREQAQEQNRLIELNNMLAHYEIHEAYQALLIQQREKDEAINNKDRLLEQRRAQEEKEQKLNSSRARIDIAVDKINEDLAYIFYSKDRLRIEPTDDGYYTLKAFGKSVLPSKISCGERNALALCYFFIDIANGNDKDSLYNNEMFLVVDDPISSFDIGNHIGIISFLRKKLSCILSSCPTTKLLLMTHDIRAMYDLEKAFSEISSICSATNNHAEYICWELQDKKVSAFPYSKYNEYTNLLKSIYSYACSPTDELELYIGNSMRRVLEAFSMFLFKEKIETISLNKHILNLLPNDSAKEYFQNSMYRLVLNNESHLRDAVKTVPENSVFTYLSTNEKQRTAKDILCFMYRISGPHILAHIPEAKEDLDSWWNDICELLSPTTA